MRCYQKLEKLNPPVSESRSKTFPGSGWSWPEPSTVASETLSAREEHPGAWGEKKRLKITKTCSEF